MACYSIQTRDRILVKGYQFLTFARNMGKNFGQNVNKNISSTYSLKLLDHAKKICYRCIQNCFKKNN